jgi:hypothetical protein
MGANAQPMNGSPTRVLLIESNVADSELVEQALASAIGHPFHLETVSLLASGLERLGREKFSGGIARPCLARWPRCSKPSIRFFWRHRMP